MRSLLLTLLAGTLVALLTTTSGCGDACEDLAEVCDRCTDASYRNACQQTVDENVQSVCSARTETYNNSCPVVVDAGASSSSGTSSGTSTSSGTGGTGGQSSTSSSSTGTAGSGGAGGAGGAAGGAGGAGGAP